LGLLESKQSQLAIEPLYLYGTEIPDLIIHAVMMAYHHPSVQNWIGVSKEQL